MKIMSTGRNKPRPEILQAVSFYVKVEGPPIPVDVTRTEILLIEHSMVLNSLFQASSSTLPPYCCLIFFAIFTTLKGSPGNKAIFALLIWLF